MSSLDDRDQPPILAPTLKVINKLEQEGVIRKATIGGSISLVFYSEPMKTDDLDIFCFLEQTSLLINLGPIYKRLEELGYKPEGECINVEGVDVQFLIPDDELTKEALETAAQVECEGVPINVFQYEYALAVKAQANRAKDWAHIATAIEAKTPDTMKLEALLQRYGLLARWKRKLYD